MLNFGCEIYPCAALKLMNEFPEGLGLALVHNPD